MLPILYVALAHVALMTAFAVIAADPRSVAGFFYHSRMLAIVHLVTLGWITSSILGALYIVGPVALLTRLPANWLDYTAFALVGIGVTGMIGHFWIAEYGGMGWSGITVAAGIVLVAVRHLPRLLRAPIAAAVRAHIGLAFLNIGGAATMGVLLGFNKVHPFLGGYVLTNVYAHAHLAAVGWATMMVVGVAYRLLPMVLPAQMPPARRGWTSVALLQAGATGLFVSLLLRTRWTWISAVAAVAGIAAFLREVLWMARHRRPRPPAISSPDPTVLHAGAALICLLLACALGGVLAVSPPAAWTLRAATAYGVFGLVGFLAQMVVAMEGRLLPLFAWYWEFARSGGTREVPSPHAMGWQPGREIVFVLWLFGVPALAGGLAFDAVPFVRAAAWALLAASVIQVGLTGSILRHAFR